MERQSYRQKLVSREILQAESVKTSNIDQDNRLAIRPKNFSEFPGQEQVKKHLVVFVTAAKKVPKTLDHVLLHGPPGLGKTTLANIIALELGVDFYTTSAPAIEKPGDLAGILANLPENGLLFVDEIHRLTYQIEEVLYSALEDYAIDIIIGQGPTARTIRMPLQPFTLVGATTRLSLLSRPLLSRFGIQERLDFYTIASLIEIISRSAKVLNVPVTREAASLLAQCSRGTPRIANRLLKRIWDFAIVEESLNIDAAMVKKSLDQLQIDEYGLDVTDLKILKILFDSYGGRPVGIETIAVILGENKATIEEVYEPYLIYRGLLMRSPRGRLLTDKGKQHFKKGIQYDVDENT